MHIFILSNKIGECSLLLRSCVFILGHAFPALLLKLVIRCDNAPFHEVEDFH